MRKTLLALFSGLLAMIGSLTHATPLGTAFTYQGRLGQNNNQPVPDGIYQITFFLYSASSGGSPLASNTVPSIPSTNGLFTTDVDFGASWFAGDERWMAIHVRTNDASQAFVLLSPRTRLAPAPNAIYASKAGTVTNGAIQLTQLGTAGSPPTVGQVLSYDGTALRWQSVAGAWGLSGNSGTIPGTHFLGTSDNQPIELKVNNARALRLEPNATSPNVVGGWKGNSVDAGVSGAIIAGGGAAVQVGLSASNRVTDDFGVVAGGAHNIAGNGNGTVNDAYYATVGGGHFNIAQGIASTIAGGAENRATNNNSAIGGGYQNTARGFISTIAGGKANSAFGDYAAIAGGENNTASAGHGFIGGGSGNQVTGPGSGTVGGGVGNTASGDSATVPGGYDNVAQGRNSFAAGRAAHALHNGSFVWADEQGTILSPTPYESTAQNQFSVRASGGVRFETAFLQVSGAGNESVYLGGDGAGGDVQLGSFNPAVANVALYNTGNNSS